MLYLLLLVVIFYFAFIHNLKKDKGIVIIALIVIAFGVYGMFCVLGALIGYFGVVGGLLVFFLLFR